MKENGCTREFIQAALMRRRLERLASMEDSTASPTRERWVCPRCGEDNKPERQHCNNCGAPAPWVSKSFEVLSQCEDTEDGFRGDTLCVKGLRDNLRKIAADLEPAPTAPCAQATTSWLPSVLEGENLTIFQEGELRLRVLPAAVSRKPFSYKLTAGSTGARLKVRGASVVIEGNGKSALHTSIPLTPGQRVLRSHARGPTHLARQPNIYVLVLDSVKMAGCAPLHAVGPSVGPNIAVSLAGEAGGGRGGDAKFTGRAGGRGSRSAARTPMKSASAPQLEGTLSASIRKTLRNRGENDFGMVLGHNPSAADDVYVPRAMWSDTADNPLKQAGNNWDARAFVEEEKKREQHRLSMKEYYRRELDKQLEENKAFRCSTSEHQSYDAIVVGGGFAGLAAVAQLAKSVRRRSLRLLLVEQGRGFGGRVCTRRREQNGKLLSFDHGCQFFTPKASQPHFSDACRAWQDAEVAGIWKGAIGTLTLTGPNIHDADFEPFDSAKVPLVGLPTMSAIGKHIIREAQSSAIEFRSCVGSKASKASWDDAAKVWTLQVNSDPVQTCVLAVATSARSCVRLLGEACASGREASKVESNVCWALLVATSEPFSNLAWDAAVLQGGPGCFAWVSRNSSKPARPKSPSPECWVLHASPDWSNPRAELEKGEVQGLLLEEFCHIFGCSTEVVVYAEAFRWNNAFPLNPSRLPEKCIVEPDRMLVAGGDWAVGDRVGDAFESGVAIAKAVRQAKNSEFEDMAKTVTADSFNKQRRTQMEKDNEHEKRMAMRKGLDEQMALIEERAKEARLQDLMEGAEIKARSIQLLCEDLDAQKKRREELKKHGNETLEAIARRATNNSNEKQMEKDELNARMREQLLQEQYRLAAQQERLKAAQRTADAKEARYFATAGRDLEERYQHESMRQDRDEKQHNLRLQLHYARREAARKKQQEKVLQGMRMQQGAADNSRELDRMGKERERDAVNDAVRRAGEAEGAKLQRQREAELALQAEHAKMMLQKQQREKAEADWPRPRITPGCSMAIDQSFVDMTAARAKGATVPKSYKPMHQVDAAKDLSKPLGAPRIKPWVDLAKSYGPGGVNGVFMGDGRTKQSLMATGGCRRILTEATARKTWSEGIGAEDMKAGEQAALQRHHANLLDKTVAVLSGLRNSAWPFTDPEQEQGSLVAAVVVAIDVMSRTDGDVQRLLAPDRGLLRNQVKSGAPTASEVFDYETLESGSFKHEHTFQDWTSLESIAASANMDASFSNPEFCGLAHELLTYDGLIVLRLETVKRFAKQGSDGFQAMLELVFPSGTTLILPLPDNHVKRSNSRISTFHLDEVPGKSLSEAKHLLVNVWFPCPTCDLGSKRLALGRGRAFRDIARAEKLKVYGPGPRIPRSQPTVNYCLSPEGTEKLALSGDLAFTPEQSLAVFISGTTSNLPVPICPHAGALPGSSQEFRYHVYARSIHTLEELLPLTLQALRRSGPGYVGGAAGWFHTIQWGSTVQNLYPMLGGLALEGDNSHNLLRTLKRSGYRVGVFCEFRDYFCGEQEDLGLADDVFPLTRRDTWRETWVESLCLAKVCGTELKLEPLLAMAAAGRRWHRRAWSMAAAMICALGLGLAAAFVGPASAAKDAATASLRRPSSWQLGAEGRSSSGPGLALSVLIAGAGPSGLLLAHRLLSAGASVRLVEGRRDPRTDKSLQGRAYALGLGIRGRTAIRTAGEQLWASIKPNGFASERFKLHLSPSFAIDLRTPEDNSGLEPSLLIYQSDLCSAMLDDLERSFSGTGRLQISFDTRLKSADPIAGSAVLQSGDKLEELAPVDVIAGCDGVNSAVRASIAGTCTGFKVEQKQLPGSLKVLRFPQMPEKLDPTAVHAIPGKGGTSAFVEPTARGGCALINWREPGKDGKTEPGLGDLADAAQAREVLAASFPLIADAMDEESAKQFVSQKASRASTVKCNTYSFGRAVLLGDAAHSTGGASGQGCNSALQDAVVLAEVLQKEVADAGHDVPEALALYSKKQDAVVLAEVLQKEVADAGHDVPEALALYSKKQVPEGHALLDLSLGPGDSAGPLRRALYGAASFAGTLLSKLGLAEPPLQTLLTTCLTSFAEIRRDRDLYFGDFPSQEQFDREIEKNTA
ncbi:Kynurenine 3-monooxygenase [Symbiodinium microadriaticum]|uniref:Kynurenine 3-monooxygenase n=1 Tax=Symbiodinium microadriaticum TaxID=2951 RepID=A0A1Q9D4X6_SYMMI|nr:Kynurenine 3-monooxygenase [Symbiodinium microadriaticum]